MIFKVDPNFKPLEVKHDYEIFNNGIFQFNITEILNYIKENPHEVELITVKTENLTTYQEYNQDYVDTVDYSIPGIIAEISPGRYNFIDGNHRRKKALQEGVEEIKVYKLRAHQHIKYLTSIESYKKYIEYWNDKVKYG